MLQRRIMLHRTSRPARPDMPLNIKGEGAN